MIDEDSSPDERGFNHPQVAQLLCPAPFLPEFFDDPVAMQEKLQAGSVDMDGLPAFVYNAETPGEDYDECNIDAGMFEGWLLPRVGRHIFVRPKAGMDKDVAATSRSNSLITDTARIVPEHLAYLVLATRFALSSQRTWGAIKDGGYHWKRSYDALLEIIWDPDYAEVIDRAVRHLNTEIFGSDQGNDDRSEEEDEDLDSTSSKQRQTFAERLRQQLRSKKSASQPTSDGPPTTNRARSRTVTSEVREISFDMDPAADSEGKNYFAQVVQNQSQDPDSGNGNKTPAPAKPVLKPMPHPYRHSQMTDSDQPGDEDIPHSAPRSSSQAGSSRRVSRVASDSPSRGVDHEHTSPSRDRSLIREPSRRRSPSATQDDVDREAPAPKKMRMNHNKSLSASASTRLTRSRTSNAAHAEDLFREDSPLSEPSSSDDIPNAKGKKKK